MNEKMPELGGGMTLELAKSMMRDLRPGSQTIDVSNGVATIRMMLEESSDLTTNWIVNTEMMEVTCPPRIMFSFTVLEWNNHNEWIDMRSKKGRQ